MTRLPLLLAALSLAACGGAPTDDGIDAPAPQPGVDVEAVRAVIEVDPDDLSIQATATLDVAHPDSLTQLILGLEDGLDVTTVAVGGDAVLYWETGDRLYVPLPPGASRSEVTVRYGGTPGAGLYADEAAGQRVLYTDGWPDRTAGWIPTVHHPSDPATFDLTLVVPLPLEVVASGRMVSDSIAEGRRHARFVLEQPAPPYTWAWAVGDFSIVEQDGAVPIRHALLADDAALSARLDRTPEALGVLTDMLGPYPYDSYTTVQVPMVYAGMENAAAPFLRADLYGAEAEGRNPVEEVNLHELVHQWWGNAVVPADWGDLWLSEGAATYFTAEAQRRMDGWDAGRRYLTLMSRSIEPEDAARRLRPDALDDPADALSPTVYQKGGAVFHLLRLALGDGVFFPAIRQIRDDYADRPLSTDAFRQSLEQASGRDLGPIFDRWVYGEGLPTLRTRWDAPTRTLAWEIEGDSGTLDSLPFELYVRQGDDAWFVPARDGVFSPPGDARPEVEPVGLLLTVERVR